MQDDLKAIEQVLTSFYSGISGTEEDACDQAALHELFCEGASILAYPREGGAERIPTALTADDYLEWCTRVLARRRFFEKGYDYRMEINGDIAQVWSRYDASDDPDFDSLTKSGTNLIHLVRVNGDWKLASMVYQDDYVVILSACLGRGI